MLKFLRTYADVILDLIFPHFCFGCGMYVYRRSEICERCREKIERNEGKICIKCGNNEKNCECKNRVFHFEALVSPFVNKGIARDGIYKMKFQPNEYTCRYFAEEMLKTVNEAYKDIKFDSVCSVPLKKGTQSKRGFNQGEILANYISRALDVDVDNHAIKRTSNSKIQHGLLSVKERVDNAYASYLPGKRKLKGNVLLVDDIATTKATLDSCALCLLKSGADRVYCVTAVISPKNELQVKENKYMTNAVI